MIRVQLPAHLRALARATREETFELEGAVTVSTIVTAIEDRYPMLRGTIRDHVSRKRRPMVRFFACERDISHESPDTELPEAIASGKEPFLIIGAISGG